MTDKFEDYCWKDIINDELLEILSQSEYSAAARKLASNPPRLTATRVRNIASETATGVSNRTSQPVRRESADVAVEPRTTPLLSIRS